MSTVRGLIRMAIALPALGLGSLVILALAWIPVRVRGARLAAWLTTLLARIGLVLFDIRRDCPHPELIRQHRGLLFANHITYFDIVLLQTFLPMRFVSMAGVRSWPFIGWVAGAIGTVFVNRAEKASRAAARQQTARAVRAEPYPPVVIFPEGGINSPGQLNPFRYGAFEIALEEKIAFLPCALLYSWPDIEWKKGETFMRAFWRLACQAGPIQAQVIPLEPVQPKPGDDARQLAVHAHRAMAAALNVAPQMVVTQTGADLGVPQERTTASV